MQRREMPLCSSVGLEVMGVHVYTSVSVCKTERKHLSDIYLL